MEATTTGASAPATYLDRDETIRRIRTALRRRSGKAWSVKGDRGTAYGWICISAPPRACTWGNRPTDRREPDGCAVYENYDTGQPGWYMSPDDRAELGKLLGLRGPTHPQGHNVPPCNNYYQEYVDRAEGREPSAFGTPDWD